MLHTQCARKRQLIAAAHDLKPLATSKDGGLLAQFTASMPIWYAQIRAHRSGRDRSGSELMRPTQYRWTTPEDKQRYAPAVPCGSIRIERAFISGTPGGAEAGEAGPSDVSELDLKKLGRGIARRSS